MIDLIVDRYVRVLFGASLQDISDMMCDTSVWKVSLAFDSSMHREQLFFDIRVRLCFKKGYSVTFIWSGV